MILFGTTSRHKIVGEGEFHCPRCSMQASYQQTAVKRYFTLYFIPLIPMGNAGEFIECKSCSGTYAMEVLTYDPAVERKKTIDAYRRMSIAFLLDVNRCKAAELEVLQDVVGDIANQDVSPEEVAADVRLAQEANVDLIKFIKRDAAEMSDDGKWLLLSTLRRIVERSGSMMMHERERLMEVGKAIGLRKKHLEAFVNNPLDDPIL